MMGNTQKKEWCSLPPTGTLQVRLSVLGDKHCDSSDTTIPVWPWAGCTTSLVPQGLTHLALHLSPSHYCSKCLNSRWPQISSSLAELSVHTHWAPCLETFFEPTFKKREISHKNLHLQSL